MLSSQTTIQDVRRPCSVIGNAKSIIQIKVRMTDFGIKRELGTLVRFLNLYDAVYLKCFLITAFALNYLCWNNTTVFTVSVWNERD